MELSDIKAPCAYSRERDSGRLQVRYVEAVGQDAAPKHHPLHQKAAVRYRPIYGIERQRCGRVMYCSIGRFYEWHAGEAVEDADVTNWALGETGAERSVA